MAMTRRAALAAVGGWGCARAEEWGEAVELWRRGEGGVHTYRIPALIETRGGALLAMADARHESDGDLPGRISLVMRTSVDGGRRWSAGRTVHTVAEGGAGDASLLLDAGGRVWCFFAYGPPGIGFRTAQPGGVTGAGVLQVHAMWSDDEGAAWSTPVDLTPQIKDPAWHAMFATSGTHFATASGRLLVPMVVLDGEKRMSARNAYSDDRGKTWKMGAAIAAGSDESKAVELADGTVVQNMRSRGNRLVARSSDGGVRFGAAVEEAALLDAGCNAGMARYRHGGREALLFTNAASRKRENLSIRWSGDGGRTWSRAKTIHAGPAAYSTVIPLRDGWVGVLYEHGEKLPTERITFARLRAEWVFGG